jgi:hypothetical protein
MVSVWKKFIEIANLRYADGTPVEYTEYVDIDGPIIIKNIKDLPKFNLNNTSENTKKNETNS